MSSPYIPNSAPIPNILIDYWMAKLTPAEFKVLMAIARKTYGWHKARDRISLKQITDLTGLHRTGVIKALDSLIESGLVLKFKRKDEFDGGDLPNEYEINTDCKGGVENKEGGSIHSPLPLVDTVDYPLVDTVDPQNTLSTKYTIQKREGDEPPPSPPPAPSKKKQMRSEATIAYGQYAIFREGEYEALCTEIGKPLVDYYIMAINNHVANNKPYKDYAAVVRQWHLRDKASGKMPNVQKVHEITSVASSPDRCAKNKYLAELAEKKLGHLFSSHVYFQASTSGGLLVHLSKDIKKEIDYSSYDTPKFKEVLLRELESCFPNARSILMGHTDNKVVNIISDLATKFKTTEATT